jgi:hypothetical protein
MNTIEQHFAGKAPHVRAIYDALLRASRAFGPFEQEPKKTSIHLARKSAFAGVATRKDAVILTIKAPSDIKDPRVIRHEQASANRWHLEVRLSEPKEVDRQLTQWLRAAYEMSG